MTYDALETQPLAVRALRATTDLVADLTLTLQLDALVRIERRRAQVLQYLRPGVQQPPPVQHLGIRLLVPVVQRRVLLIEQSVQNIWFNLCESNSLAK